MTLFHYQYNSEFSCIIKLSSSGTELQRIRIPRSDLMELALVCWENSIDKLDTEREELCCERLKKGSDAQVPTKDLDKTESS